LNLAIAGSEEGRHHFCWSISVHWKWNYFSLAGGKRQTTVTADVSWMGLYVSFRMLFFNFHLLCPKIGHKHAWNWFTCVWL